LNLDGSSTDRVGDIAQRLGGIHNRGRGLVEHGRIRGTCRVKEMELVTVGWILEYLIQLVELGLIVVLDEVGDSFTNVLDLLIPVTERSKRDRVDSLVDSIGAVMPVQNSCDALMPSGVAQESITRQLVEPVGGKGDRDTSVLRVIKRRVLRGTETWTGEDRSTTCRPSAWEECDTGNLGQSEDG